MTARKHNNVNVYNDYSGQLHEESLEFHGFFCRYLGVREYLLFLLYFIFYIPSNCIRSNQGVNSRKELIIPAAGFELYKLEIL